MANSRLRSKSMFPGLALISVGVLLLLHNYSGFNIAHFIWHWWPLVFIFWGAIKLYERTAASRTGNAAQLPLRLMRPASPTRRAHRAGLILAWS
jgi:hypothetical protein